MDENEWVELMAKRIRKTSLFKRGNLTIETGFRLAYGFEIHSHDSANKPAPRSFAFQTDFAVIEKANNGDWKPRVIAEAKIGGVSTHDAITYSNKAAAHQSVYPFLRYGVMLGKMASLPGRLYRHGSNFDFMISFKNYRPNEAEIDVFTNLLRYEVRTSRTMEKLLFDSRRQDRDRFTMLHRKLMVS